MFSPGDLLRLRSLHNTYKLKRLLEQKLPNWMIPSAFVIQETLPLTRNGKVDRHSLHGFDHVQTEQQDHYVALQTTAERSLCNKWEELLGLKRVGKHYSCQR